MLLSTKLSLLPNSEGPSNEANAFSFSAESIPAKLSCGFKCGRWRALGDIAEAKSSSQLSLSAFSVDRNLSAAFELRVESDSLVGMFRG